MKKFSIAILLLFTVLYSYSQKNNLTQKASISFNNITLTDAFEQLENTTGISMAYNSNNQVLNSRITKSYNNKPVRYIIEDILNDSELNYKQIGEKIVIYMNKNNQPIRTSSLLHKHTITGYVESAESGEKLPGASVYLADMSNIGTITNTYGFYSLTIPENTIKLTVSYIGYSAQTVQIDLKEDKHINFSLKQNNEIEEVTVSAKKTEVEKVEMSRIDVSIKTIQKIPALLGEVDVLKAIQLLPGVQSGSEGTSGLFVRGGGADQNLILIDGVPVYNANHLFGFFSVFNSDAISDVSIIKGGFPARYGGRLSSVLDIRMKEGNMKKYSGAVSIGLISSKFMFEGPIIKDKTAFIVSARRTYIDALSRPVQKMLFENDKNNSTKMGYYFWDINAKVNHKFSDKDRVYLSVYTGRDKAYAKTKETWESQVDIFDFDLKWGNVTSAFRWNHILGNKLFSNTTLTYSKYLFNYGMISEFEDSDNKEFTKFGFGYNSGIEDYSAKIDFDYIPTPKHNIKFGANYIYHTFNPGIQAMKLSSNDSDIKVDTIFGNKNIYAQEYSVFAEDEFKVFDKLKVNTGVHYSGFYVSNTLYQSLQPRFSLRYMINPKLSVKAAYSHMTQYLHLLTSETKGMPTDLWLPVTDNIKPQKSIQYALGSAYSFRGFNISVEAYYKTMTNLIEYKEGANFVSTFEESEGRAWENKIETDGIGTSYGFELLIKRDVGKTTGWIGYTWAKTDRQFENVNFGKPFPYIYDRRHDISIVLAHKFNDKIDVGLTWVFGTGNPFSMATERYADLADNYSVTNNDGYAQVYLDKTIGHIEKRNNLRKPAYHRLDVGINFRKQKKHGKRTWGFGAYNAYNNINPFFIKVGHNISGKKVLYSYGLFPIIPSITYKYEF